MVSLSTLDWVVIGLYFALLSGVAIRVILKKQKDTEDYFLAGRNVGWFMVGASISASNIGSEHVFGLAGTGATPSRAMYGQSAGKNPRGRHRSDEHLSDG